MQLRCAAAGAGAGSARASARPCPLRPVPCDTAARARRAPQAPGAVIAWWVIGAAVAVAGVLLVDGARGSRGSLWRLESGELECRVSRAVGI